MEERAGQASAPTNARSDTGAKAAFCAWLLLNGYSEARSTAFPADVVARKNDCQWLFEVKYTKASRKCFGAATLTEWAAAARDPEHFRFVIAYERGGEWRFDCYTPEEFMAFSSVPPFKIYFSIPLDGQPHVSSSRLSKRVHLTKSRLRRMTQQFEELRKIED